ncbi:MAG: sulfite exporter TauE/SafE family protein [Thermodesulfobacteriaceae bacterium]|nr:sulfite exporter TauE/SafE family protein [Thermodesulfobacteriaceae bacterium]
MEWLYLHMPISGVDIFWPGLVILGLGVGILGGFYGMGGAWMITPGLNILGFPMAFAIGTDIAHIAGKSIVSTMRHARFGNVDYKLGVAMILGTIAGFEVGAQMIMWFERIGKVDLYVRIIYLLILAFIAYLVYLDFKKLKSKKEVGSAKVDKLETGITWYKTLHKIKIPPVMHFKEAMITCSVWLPLGVGFFTGWIAGILGIGGGLIRMPALIYFVGCPTHVAVGTDLFEVMISGLYGAFTYTWKGRTELIGALVMLLGASLGAQFGAVATKYFKGMQIRILFASAVACAAISILLKLIARIYHIVVLDHASSVVILGGVFVIMMVILIKTIAGMRQEVRMKKQQLT